MRPAFGAIALTAATLILGACGGTPGGVSEPAPPRDDDAPHQPASPAPLPAAPWSAAPLDADAVPDVFVNAWRNAENRVTCALLAPESTGRPEATARRAEFSGGWAVAYDLAELRSAFGVAGTGATVDGSTYDDWPHRIEWADGSSAGYGPEGGAGPNQLAYLAVQGQGCLYNVWSRLGRAHLEALLASLRFVEAD